MLDTIAHAIGIAGIVGFLGFMILCAYYQVRFAIDQPPGTPLWRRGNLIFALSYSSELNDRQRRYLRRAYRSMLGVIVSVTAAWSATFFYHVDG